MRVRWQVITICGLCGLLFTQFQNCAPAPQAVAATGQDSVVKPVDDFNKAQISFPVSQMQITSQTLTADLGGLCNRSHNGAEVGWEVTDSQGQVISEGSSVCAGGQFQLSVPDTKTWQCGVTYSLVALSDWGDSTQMSVVKRCQPLAAQQIANNGQLPGSKCQMEYDIDPMSGQGVCQDVCYQGNIVTLSQNLNIDQCRSLTGQ